MKKRLDSPLEMYWRVSESQHCSKHTKNNINHLTNNNEAQIKLNKHKHFQSL